MTLHLEGKVALVTGASGGIGRAIATRLAADGAAVVLAFGTDAKGAADALNHIEASGGRALTHAADLRDAGAVAELFDATTRAFGGIDILVCNAGSYLQKPIAETTEAEFDDIFAVNTRGTFLCLREGARRLHDGGRIVATSSIATHVVWPGNASYSGSKAAVEQFVRVLSRELGGRQITVNAVAPGATDTAMMPDAVRESAPGMTALGRIGTPTDIADVVAFLCSDAARWLTGRIIPVDGGIAP